MRALVLGGTGFIGRHVVEQLIAAGHEAVVVHRGRNPVSPGARSVVLDGSGRGSLKAALSHETPDLLVDMIGYTEADADELLSALPRGLSRLILVSSGDVYSSYGAFLGHEDAGETTPPASENAALRSRMYPYRERATSPADFRHDYEKILVERKLQELSPVPVTVLRLPMVYGPADPQQRVQAAVRRLRENPDRLGLAPREAPWRGTRGYVEDVAFGIALAAADPRAAGEVFNLGEPDALTEREWIAAIGRTIGWAGRVVADLSVAPSLPVRWEAPLMVSTEKIRRELGYDEPVGRDEGIRRAAI